MKTEKTELLNQVENRLRFIITLSIFFPTIVYSFFIFADNQEKEARTVSLQYASMVSFYLMTYLVFAIFGKKLTERELVWFDRFLLVGVASFIIPLFIFGTEELKFKNIGEFISFNGSIYIMFGVAVLSLVLMAIQLIYNIFTKQNG